jgi:hypothetical protein
VIADRLARLARGFARFWWDFLVGDTPELFVAALAILGVVALVSEAGHDHGLAAVVLVVMALGSLSFSVARAARAHRASRRRVVDGEP